MIRSMTGFGRGISENTTGKVTVEMKSVNHRYLDLSIKMPKIMNAFETKIRNMIKEEIGRGKMDLYITFEQNADSHYTIQYNSAIAGMYLDNLRKMAGEFGLKDDITTVQLSRYPDVMELKEEDTDEEAVWALVEDALKQALGQFVTNREEEGARLAQDLNLKVEQLDSYVNTLESRSPEIIQEYKTKLMDKVKDLLEAGTLDENRIAAEVTVYADKVCIDEEMVRLHSHVQEAKNALASGENVGRKMDFLAQEMNREANTILSKSTDVSIANLGIDMKTLIEKIREQIQNIE